MATGVIREANGMGFERIPLSETMEEPRQRIYDNNLVIPRGVVINWRYIEMIL